MKLFLFVILLLIVAFALALYLGQGKFIYFPRGYNTGSDEFRRTERLAYRLEDKPQFLYLVGESAPQTRPPERIWWIFGGNGSTALDWLDFAEGCAALSERSPESARPVFALFDYPGYGINQGRPHPDRIRESVDAAFAALAERYALDPDDVAARSRALGHSLGAAIALDTAVRHRLDEVIALSPFTTMQAMARKQVGPVLAPLLRHHYDNEASIDALLARKPRPSITIYHGEDDRMIPHTMGQSLADRNREVIRFHSVPGAGHNDIASFLEAELIEKLAGKDTAPGRR